MKAADPGLQAERTRLAWSRTAMTLVIDAVLLVRIAITTRDPVVIACGTGMVALSAAVFTLAAKRSRTLTADRQASPAPGLVRGLGLATALAALLVSLSLLAA